MKYISGQSMAELIRDLQLANGDKTGADSGIANTLTSSRVSSDGIAPSSRRDTLKNDNVSTHNDTDDRIVNPDVFVGECR